MTRSAWTGPILVSSGDVSNPDLYDPSAIAYGLMLTDPRTPALLAAKANGWLYGGSYVLIDQVPSTLEVNNIAVAADPASGTALTLVSSTAAGITVTTSATTIAQTGQVVPSGALFIDGIPAPLAPAHGGGTGVQIFNPATAISRAVSVTGVSGGSGGTVTIHGYDIYGYSMTQTITLAAGVNTVNTTKAFKAVTSVVPNFTDASHAISVGTGDVYGFPLYVPKVAYTSIYWNSSLITANTGFVAGVTTTASATTGDVRGTYATQSASDGTKSLQVFVNVAPANISSLTGLVGVAQF